MIQPGSIDYTNIGYEALREAMLAQARLSLPEWSDFSENDLGVLLVELFAYASDITLYYQNRIATNLLPATSDEPEALVQLLRLIGYELQPPSPATANLRVAFNATEVPPIVIPAVTQFRTPLASGGEIVFETGREVLIQATHLTPPDARGLVYFFPLPVVQGTTVVADPLGYSDGSPNQMFKLAQKPVLAGSIQVRVLEPGGIETRWQAMESLASSGPGDRHFAVQRDGQGGATLVFGDGINGSIPPAGSPATPVPVKAVYRVGGGPEGNLPTGARFRSSLVTVREATNPQAAAGGAPGESLDRARFFAPRLFRTQNRAVTGQDFEDLAMQVPGVGKAKAVAINWNLVLLYVAPTGQVDEPSDLLKRDLLAFFESRRMLSAQVAVVGPQAADIYLMADVRAQPYFLQSDVRRAVEEAVAGYLAFEAVDFGQPVFLSKVYDVIQSLPQVASLTITEFSRSPNRQVDLDGIIELQPFELPRPGYRDNLATPAGPGYRPPIITTIQGGVAG